MLPDPPSRRAALPSGAVRRVLARDGWCMLAAGLATLAAEIGTYLLGVLGGAGQEQAALASLAVAAVLLALACPVLAASGKDGVASLLRAAAVADASAVTLIVLWLSAPFVTFLGAAKAYCTFAAVALLSASVVRWAPRPAARYAVAVATAIVLLAALATPFWIGGLLEAVTDASARTITACAVHANPFYSITAAIVEQTEFVWHQHAVMLYRHVDKIGHFHAPALRWYSAPLIYGSLAGLLAAARLLRRRRKRNRPPAAPAG